MTLKCLNFTLRKLNEPKQQITVTLSIVNINDAHAKHLMDNIHIDKQLVYKWGSSVPEHYRGTNMLTEPQCWDAPAPSVRAAEADGGLCAEPHCRVDWLLELRLHPVQEADAVGRHCVEAEQSGALVQEDPDPVGRRAGGNLNCLLLASVDEGDGGGAAAKDPWQSVVSQPAVVGGPLNASFDH